MARIADLQTVLLKLAKEKIEQLYLASFPTALPDVSYDADAHILAADAGLSERVTRRQLDLAAAPEAIEPHDIVVLHRVVCCYPDYQRLLAAAAEHAKRLLVFSHPPHNLASRAVFAAQNLVFRLRRSPFRTFVHDPAAMSTAAEHDRLRTVYRHRGLTWHVVGLTASAT